MIWWDHPDGPLIPCDPDLVVVRASHDVLIERARHFVDAGIPVINDPEAHQRSRDKWFQAQTFFANGIAHPHSVNAATMEWTGDDDIVLKPRRGHSGNGVRRVQWSQLSEGDKVDMVAQRFVNVVADYRVVVIGGEALAWGLRTPPPGEFRSNLALGALLSATPCPSVEAEHLAVNAVAALGLDLGGVDLVMGPDGPLVLEVNAATTLFGPTPQASDDVLGALTALISLRAANTAR